MVLALRYLPYASETAIRSTRASCDAEYCRVAAIRPGTLLRTED